ncbi:MAG: ATP-grasp domain-containing protein [Halieaceae bacterium]|jgi:predicted ATP-grasp superfamily ATP-dependent carboligase|nr:ATP-grasp domain-containing protein [Halieaceae bacterium]
MKADGKETAPGVLLTLGRLPKALELARAFHGMGCRVVIAEPFRWHLARPSRAVSACYRVTAPNSDPTAYLSELLEIIERENIRYVMPVSEEALHVAGLKPRLPDAVTLLCPDFAVLAELHDKLQFARYCQQRGLSVPETHPENSDAGRALADAGDYVAKPAHSCSGIGVELCLNGHRHAPGAAGMLVQRYVSGDHLSSLSLLHEGRCLASVVYRGTVFAGTVAICFERVDNATAVQAWLERFCDHSDYSGFIAFDFVVDRAGIAWALECNPRVTSGVHFFNPVELARALLQPQRNPVVGFKPQRRMQWAYSTLTEAYAALLRPAEARRRFRQLFSARDVVWSPRDPLPFLLMTPMSWEILWPAMTSSLTLGEATQRDIAWLSGEGEGVSAAARDT